MVVHPAQGAVVHPAQGAVVHLAQGAVVHPAQGVVVHLAQGVVVHLAQGAVVHPARCRGTVPLGAEVLPCSVQRYCPARIRGANLTLCIRSEVEPDLRDGGEHVKNIF